jgi:hypothetical protein
MIPVYSASSASIIRLGSFVNTGIFINTLTSSLVNIVVLMNTLVYSLIALIRMGKASFARAAVRGFPL